MRDKPQGLPVWIEELEGDVRHHAEMLSLELWARGFELAAYQTNNKRMLELLREVADHGRRTTVPLGPEAEDLLARIDAAIGP